MGAAGARNIRGRASSVQRAVALDAMRAAAALPFAVLAAVAAASLVGRAPRAQPAAARRQDLDCGHERFQCYFRCCKHGEICCRSFAGAGCARGAAGAADGADRTLLPEGLEVQAVEVPVVMDGRARAAGAEPGAWVCYEGRLWEVVDRESRVAARDVVV